MSNISFTTDFDKKIELNHDAALYSLSVSAIMRRMVDIYLSDPAFRKRVLQYNPYEGEF